MKQEFSKTMDIGKRDSHPQETGKKKSEPFEFPSLLPEGIVQAMA